MKLTEREKVMVLVLPAVLIFTIYGWFFYPAKHNALTKALAAVEDARAKEPELQNKVLVTQARVGIATQGLQDLERQKSNARLAWEAATAHCTDPALRAERIERLNLILKRQGLHVVEDVEAEASRDSTVAAAVQALCDELAAMSAKHKPQLRKVRMYGTYLNVLAALDDLANREVVAIPVGLMMKDAYPGYTLHEWVLLVWI
jgi:hypothetical protein